MCVAVSRGCGRAFGLAFGMWVGRVECRPRYSAFYANARVQKCAVVGTFYRRYKLPQLLVLMAQDFIGLWAVSRSATTRTTAARSRMKSNRVAPSDLRGVAANPAAPAPFTPSGSMRSLRVPASDLRSVPGSPAAPVPVAAVSPPFAAAGSKDAAAARPAVAVDAAAAPPAIRRRSRARRRVSVTSPGGGTTDADTNDELSSGRRFSTLLDRGALALGDDEDPLDMEEPTKRRPRCFIPSTSPLRICWDMLTMVMLMYLAVTTPLRLGFDLNPEGAEEAERRGRSSHSPPV